MEIFKEFEPTVIEKFEKFSKILKEVNERINLISKKDIDKIFEKHIGDSLLYLKILKGKNICDIGSGAGFPGIPLAIVKNEWNFILIERNKKKAEFLRKIKRELNELNQMMSDLAINNLTDGKTVKIKDEFNNEYIPIYKVAFKKAN